MAVSKYRAVKTEIDGITFASKREAIRYSELKLLVKAGYIRDLELQPKFPLVVNGIKVCIYIADFIYRGKDGSVCIEDAKGVRTPVYKLKNRLFHACYPSLRITEVP